MRSPTRSACRSKAGGSTFASSGPSSSAVPIPNLALAYECLRRGGCAGAVLNAANEVGVAAFLDGKIRFTDIARINEQTLSRMPQGRCSTLEQYRETDAAARETALSLI